MRDTEPIELAEVVAAARQKEAAAEKLQRSVLRASEAGASQRDIAKALGVTQSAVSQMIAASRVRSGLARGPIGRKLADHRAEIIEIARSRGASRVRVFGSVARGEDTESSDIDLLVSMPGQVGLLAITALGNEISDVLGVPVDVVPEQLVRPEALYGLAASAVAL